MQIYAGGATTRWANEALTSCRRGRIGCAWRGRLHRGSSPRAGEEQVSQAEARGPEIPRRSPLGPLEEPLPGSEDAGGIEPQSCPPQGSSSRTADEAGIAAAEETLRGAQIQTLLENLPGSPAEASGAAANRPFPCGQWLPSLNTLDPSCVQSSWAKPAGLFSQGRQDEVAQCRKAFGPGTMWQGGRGGNQKVLALALAHSLAASSVPASSVLSTGSCPPAF
uniref:uncharacterized protein LOC114588272 n=1 Tax=Podarcis muralis TaxID=64176 RepID=UPI00109F58D1|nr:uncharacterized protein LOC114588272 [Podarcis muralis]